MQYIIKSTYLFFAVCISVSCGNNNSQHVAETAPVKDSNSTAQLPPAEIVTGPLPYFFGAGEKKEWTIEISAAPDGSFPYSLQYSDGKNEKGSLSREPLMVDNKPNMASGQVKMSGTDAAGLPVVVLLEVGSCNAGQSEKETHTVTVLLESEKLEGCGHYSED